MKPLAILLASLAMCSTALAADVGDVLPPFNLNDAQGQEHSLSDDKKRIYATADRAGDKLFKAAMKSREQSTLDAQQAIVVNEISAAPSFVRRIIKSSLKDRSYTTWVDERGKSKKWLPYRDDQIAVIDLDQRKIVAISYLSELDELEAVLDQQPADLSPRASPAPSTPAPAADSN